MVKIKVLKRFKSRSQGRFLEVDEKLNVSKEIADKMGVLVEIIDTEKKEGKPNKSKKEKK